MPCMGNRISTQKFLIMFIMQEFGDFETHSILVVKFIQAPLQVECVNDRQPHCRLKLNTSMIGWSLSVRLNPSKESTCPVEYPLWCIEHMGIRRSHLWKQVIELYLHPTKTNAFWKLKGKHATWFDYKGSHSPIQFTSSYKCKMHVQFWYLNK